MAINYLGEPMANWPIPDPLKLVERQAVDLARLSIMTTAERHIAVCPSEPSGPLGWKETLH